MQRGQADEEGTIHRGCQKLVALSPENHGKMMELKKRTGARNANIVFSKLIEKYEGKEGRDAN